MITARVAELDVGDDEAGVRGTWNVRAIHQPLIAQRPCAGGSTLQSYITTSVSGKADGRMQNDRAAVVDQREAVIRRGGDGDRKQIGQSGRRRFFSVIIIAPCRHGSIGANGQAGI